MKILCVTFKIVATLKQKILCAFAFIVTSIQASASKLTGSRSKLSGRCYPLSGHFPSENGTFTGKTALKPLRLLFLPLTNPFPPHLRACFNSADSQTNFTSE
jgi:hypothetical protein